MKLFFFKRKGFSKKSFNFFVSIGAGINQLPLIREAKKLGFHVIGVDINYKAPGLNECDLKIIESINNYKQIYQKLRELPVDGDIYGIMTRSFGAAIQTTAFLTDKFNLPFMPFTRTEDFINKKKMKLVFKKNNIQSPSPCKINLKNTSRKNFPIIVKPQTGHGKINVRLIKNEIELNDHIAESDPATSLIVEKFISGDEIIVIGIVHEKKFYIADITDKITTPHPYFVDLMHISPSKYFYLFEEITEKGQQVADAFEITNSPLIMEFIIDQNNEIHLIEAVPEFGGEYLSDILVPARTGYNFIREAIKAATGSEFKTPSPEKITKSVVVKYIKGKEGTLISCDPSGPQKNRKTVYSKIFKETGTKVNLPKSNPDRIGVVIVQNKNPQKAINAAEAAAKSFNIIIE